jgi:hypothetical protein
MRDRRFAHISANDAGTRVFPGELRDGMFNESARYRVGTRDAAIDDEQGHSN